MEDALWKVSTEQDVKLASERAGYMYVECGAWQMGNIAGRGKRNRWACAEIAWRMVIEQQMRAIPLKSIADVAGE